MSKSNSDITSQKLMKQRLDALIKAGDEMHASLHALSQLPILTPATTNRLQSKVRAWDAAKKTP